MNAWTSPESIEALRFRLAPLLGGAVEYHEALTSTQARAKELAVHADKALVIAGEQTAGRGRTARRWESPKGSGLYFSILFHPALPSESLHMVNIAAAMAVASAARSVLGRELELKWPNDLLTSGPDGQRKVCGILSETASRSGQGPLYCVTGIGLNMFAPEVIPPELESRAGWLFAKGQGTFSLADFLGCLTENFFDWVSAMESGGTRAILSEYRKKCASVGRAVRVETESETLTGLCSGIGDCGELEIETPEGKRLFYTADVIHARLEPQG